MRWASIAACALIAAWMLRWHVETTSNHESESAYLLDRWTGTVYLLSGAQRYDLVPFNRPAARPKSADEFLDKKP